MMSKRIRPVYNSFVTRDVEAEAEAGSGSGGSGPFSVEAMEAVLFVWKRKRENSTASAST